MRIHTNEVLSGDIYDAAKAARVTVVRAGLHNSRIRDHAWDIALEGESRRATMAGTGKAATWDQWGVFLDYLFMEDDDLTIPRVYPTRYDFDARTAYRFEDAEFPVDYHGDHTFRYSGIPCEQQCTKCSARTRWER
jgi:hypothetical protein